MTTISTTTISSYRKRFGNEGRASSRRFVSPSGARGPTTGAWGGTVSAAAETHDIGQAGAMSVGFKAPCNNEKTQMQSLNDRFVSYIEKVRMLEQRNEALRVELERCRGSGPSRLAELCAHEVADLRRHVDKLTNEKAIAEVQRDNFLLDIKRIRAKLQEEILLREEAERSTQSFRQDVDLAALARVDLERKVESLQDELRFLKKLHEEELREIQVQSQQQQQQQQGCVDLSDLPDLTLALREIRVQYENLASKNTHRSEDWYDSKFADLTEAANRNKEALRAAKQEVNGSRLQVQALTCEVDTLKATNESLELQMRQMEENFALESLGYQDAIRLLEENILNLKDELGRNLHKYEDLLNAKIALDIEIATHRKLMDGSHSLCQTSQPLTPRDPVLESRTKVLMKSTESRDGEVVNQTTQNHEEPE